MDLGPLVFGGAPIINAFVAMAIHPPEGGFGKVPLLFWLGFVMAACGGFLVAKFNPTAQAPSAAPGAPPAKH